MTIGLPAAMPSSYEIKVPKPYGFGTFFVMRDQFRYMLKIGKIESWSGFELFQPYFLLTISRDREESMDF